MADCRILLIEDQHSIATMTEAMLHEKWGCEVVKAHNFQQTKTILESARAPFFLAISDLNLPDASNGEIIDLIAEHQQPVIAISGHFSQDLHEQLTSKGVIDYVLKNNINAYDYLVNLVGRLYLNQNITVLIVDDSESVQKLTGTYLEKQFLNVMYAKHGEEALSILSKHPEIKLALVDAEMPVMNGLTFTAKARLISDKNQLCIIGISSSLQKNLSAQFLKHGANDFISKPHTYDEVTCRVNQNLSMLEYIAKVQYIADYDFLTEIPNRRHFFVRGSPIIEEAIKLKKHMVVGIIDIDFFKKINDTFGHEAGDAALKHVASTVETHLGDHIKARLGGEEFGFILCTKNFNESQTIVEGLRKAFENSSIHYDDQEIKFTVSIGASYELKQDLDETLKLADQHLYLAKMSGRNKVVWNHGQPKIEDLITTRT
jgi:diguanylate cyclase (GGDEF)-like protein